MNRIIQPTHKQKADLKKRVWSLASEWCRRTESYLGYPDVCQCVTCGAIRPWQKIDAGHFVSGRHDRILFDERNFHPQCQRCNRFQQGSWPKYYDYMLKKYGQGVIDELLKLNKEIFEYGYYELKALQKEWRRKLNEVKNGNRS